MLKPLGFAAALLLAGCADPVARPGTWQAGGVNDRNLRAMMADPAHERLGIGATDSHADTAAAAVQRLRQGKAYPLLDPRGSGAGSVGR
ncbi:hypothetical protein [Teichococcus aestuarii]|uniref:hypothetical protein n=2 Tax=Teichococcus aestuarii TaxID=568898 RepID=UPI003622D585